MHRLSEEQILEINSKCPEGQGVFMQPFGIPNHIKGLVVYSKWTSGERGGSCFDDEDTEHEHYAYDRPADAFSVLDFVLKEINPHITFLQLHQIQQLMKSNTKTDYGYYGDYTEDTIEWIELSELYKFLGCF